VEGTGLGLNICKTIIDKFKGVLDFHSDEYGSEFYFELEAIEVDKIVDLDETSGSDCSEDKKAS
jgi:nitrogen-specific signal transduction histidine kinase